MKLTKRQLLKIIKEEIMAETQPRHGLDPVKIRNGKMWVWLKDGRQAKVVSVTSDTIQLKSGERIIPSQIDRAKTNMSEAPEPGSGSPEEWQGVERQNVITFLAEDGISVDMDNPMSNEQLHAILMIARGRSNVTVKNGAGEVR